MFFNLLHFTGGSLPYNYFLFAFVAALGVLQIVAARYNRSRLLIFAPNVSTALGCIMLVGAFVWFFNIQADLFIPGLAGGELFLEFAGAFASALIVTRLIALARMKLFVVGKVGKAILDHVMVRADE